MLGRRSDVYSSLARFVSSIACKRQTSSHRHVEKKEEDEMKREERWYLPHEFQDPWQKKKEMVWRVCKDMRGKSWERGSPLLSCSHSKSFGHRCYDLLFISSRIHTCTSSDTHSLTQHSFDASPAPPAIPLYNNSISYFWALLSLASSPACSITYRSPQPFFEKFKGTRWVTRPISVNCFKMLPP